RKCGCNAQQRKNQFCNFLENGVAILWKNDLQLSGKMSCKKHKYEQFFQKGECRIMPSARSSTPYPHILWQNILDSQVSASYTPTKKASSYQ
ncbi:MAG: hypothetical protein KBG13_11245, partial [Syntrophaceae bacterium]|nr:hypothetical protein [Syntrophaceae bacterium]